MRGQTRLQTSGKAGIRQVCVLPGPWNRSIQRDVGSIGLQRVSGHGTPSGVRSARALRVLWRQRQLQDLPLFGLWRLGSCSPARRPNRTLPRVRRPRGRRLERSRLSPLSWPGLHPRRKGNSKMTTTIKTSRDIATSLSGSAFRRVTLDSRISMFRAIPTWGGRTANPSSLLPKSGPRNPRPR